MGTTVKDDKRESTTRRSAFAIDWLRAMAGQKIGRPDAWGDLTVRVRFQAGEITAVKAIDEVDYR